MKISDVFWEGACVVSENPYMWYRSPLLRNLITQKSFYKARDYFYSFLYPDGFEGGDLIEMNPHEYFTLFLLAYEMARSEGL